jgi:hypothetical protein
MRCSGSEPAENRIRTGTFIVYVAGFRHCLPGRIHPRGPSVFIDSNIFCYRDYA